MHKKLMAGVSLLLMSSFAVAAEALEAAHEAGVMIHCARGNRSSGGARASTSQRAERMQSTAG